MFNWYDPEVFGTVADWVSGVGTLLAIIVSLYISLRDNYKRLMVTAYYSYYIYSNGMVSEDGFLTIDIVNNGKIPLTIEKIGFSKFKINRHLPSFIQRNFQKIFGLSQIIGLDSENETLPVLVGPQEKKTFKIQGTIEGIQNSSFIPKRTYIYAVDSTKKYFFSTKKAKF